MAERQFEVISTDGPVNSEEKTKHPTKAANVKPPTLRQKIKRAFIANEVGDVKSYALFDVVIPAAKRVIKDLIMNSIDMVFYGKPQGRGRSRSDSPYYDYEYTRYSRTSRDLDRDDRRSDRQKTESRHDIGVRELDRVMFNEKDDAIDALGYLFDNIEEYGVATVADFLSNAGLNTNSIHHKWGWYAEDLKGSSVREDPDGGWYCDMPRPRGVT